MGKGKREEEGGESKEAKVMYDMADQRPATTDHYNRNEEVVACTKSQSMFTSTYVLVVSST